MASKSTNSTTAPTRRTGPIHNKQKRVAGTAQDLMDEGSAGVYEINPDEPYGEIQEAIARLDLNLSHLYEEIHAVERRLMPALDQVADAGPSVREGQYASASHIGSQLTSLNERVEIMTDHLNNIRGRIVL